jgi:sodium-dependent dicarboxylate transporter 2/3/5
MGSTALLSLWVSNTATAMLMLPIAASVVELVHPGEKAAGGRSNFAVALMLAIAYGSSIGGMGTVIGTPPRTRCWSGS